MESGTYLHIALLRKISNAKNRHRFVDHWRDVKPQVDTNVHNAHAESQSSVFGKSEVSKQANKPGKMDQNFVLTGWSTEDNEIKGLFGVKKMNRGLFKKFIQEQTQVKPSKSARGQVKTSEGGQRSHPRSYSFRKQTPIIQNHNRPSSTQSHQNNLQPCNKLNIVYREDAKTSKNKSIKCSKKSENQHKQNQSAPSLRGKAKLVWSQSVINSDRSDSHSFTNFVNLNNVRARKFFKL